MKHLSPAPFVALVGLVGLISPVCAQTISLGYTAGAAQFSGSTTDFQITVSSSATSPSVISLTSGMPNNGIGLGVLSFTATGRGPDQKFETLPFTFTRSLSLSVNGNPDIMDTETVSGSLGVETGGSAGQYRPSHFVLDSNSATYSLGNYGTLQADFQSGQADYTGLSGSITIPIMANFTYRASTAAPETSPLVSISLGCVMLAALGMRARHRLERAD